MKLNVTKIRLELERLHWSQSELGRRMGESKQWVWWVLNTNGNHTFQTVEKLAKVLGLDPKDLIK